MGRTNVKKAEARDARLRALPQSERLLKSAVIKKKEGRVLAASEKHALKMSSEHGDILRLWEKLRTMEDKDADGTAASPSSSKKTAYQHKYPTVEKLLHLIAPKFNTVVRTPSGSRVIQSMIKYGSSQQVEKLLKNVSKDFASSATDAYAHFVVSALIRHASHDVFRHLLSAVMAVVPQLVSHKFGIEVIHNTYSSRWCSPTDRDILLLAVFKENPAVMKRWAGYPNMEEVLTKNPSMQKRLLTRLFDLCDKLVSQKEAVGYPFVQRLTCAYIRHGTRHEVSELCDTLRPHIASLATTREGAPLASLAFSLTEPKRRKEVLHSFNATLGELVANKYAAPVVARLFDLMYDAQMLKKYVANDMVSHIGQVVGSPYGYLILIHLLTPRASRKTKLLLPNWEEHNLFSMENKQWNQHQWLTDDYATEVVEICSKSAVTSHLSVLPMIVDAFVNYIKDEANAEKINKHHAALIARELLHVADTEPLYQSALSLSPETRRLLGQMAPASGKRPREEEEKEEEKGAKKGEKAGGRPAKKVAVERRVSSATPSSSVSTLSSATNSKSKKLSLSRKLAEKKQQVKKV